jgi:hypothetical protein
MKFRHTPKHGRLVLLAFVALAIIPATASAEDPTATATAANVTTAGDTSYAFTVSYADDGSIDTDTIGDGDVRVAGPGGFDTAAAFVSVNFKSQGSPRVATYSIVPPGGSWDAADNGTYNVAMQANQVTDSLGNPVKAGIIGSFSVNAPAGTPAPTHLGNISTRLRVETGDNVLIGGFIVTGTQPKKVMVRAIGPSLPVSGALANPTLELYTGQTLLESNDNWVDSPNKQAINDSTIPPSSDLESAIVRTLPANNSAYTAVVRGVNSGTGVGLVEVYDLDGSADSKLANISTRGSVQTEANVMIGGFIVLNGSQKVIVRAIGPSLSIAGKLADPLLELHDNNGALLQSDDNWRTGGQEAEIMATTVPPTNDFESALVRTLSPGNYTAIVRGVGDTTGVALVEVFALQ